MRHYSASEVRYDPEIEDVTKAAFPLHRITNDLHTGWHIHSRGQLLYAENGVTRLYTTSSSFLLPARHCAWIPPNEVHQVTSSSPNLFLRTIYFQIESDNERSFYKEVSIFQVSDLLREMIVYSERWGNTPEASKEEQCFMEALRLILPDLGGASLGLRLPASRHPKVQSIISYLLENLSEPASVKSAGEMMAMSTRTVARLFQQELGMSFTGFLKVARIIKALELLAVPGANVAETAYRVGYDSVPTFSNSFLEIVGSRPQSFLQKRV